MNQTIGDRIALIIEYKSLKKVEFARILNIDQSYVTQLIKGRNSPSDRLIDDICEKINISEPWLRTGEGEMSVELDRDEAIVAWSARITRSDFDNSFVPKFAEMLTKLDENDWKTLEKMARFLYEGQQKKD